MPISEFTRKLIEQKLSQYCTGKNPVHASHEVRLIFKIRGNGVTLYESRRAFRNPSTWVNISIAQFRYDNETNQWTLYYADRNSRWHPYTVTEPNANFDDLLNEVDRDPTKIFWG